MSCWVSWTFSIAFLGRCRFFFRTGGASLAATFAQLGLGSETGVSIRNPTALLVLGPFVAFVATGYFSGFGAVTAEIYPTAIRATAQGFTYNIGRIASAVAPVAVGSLAQTQGFGAALSLSSVAFLLAALTWIWIPETKGRELL